MNKLSYLDLSNIVSEVLEETLGIEQSELYSISGLIDYSAYESNQTVVEIDIDDDEAITGDYLQARNKFISVAYNPYKERAYIRIILGARCKNPYLANNQIDIFSKSSKYARTFEIEDAECDRGLCLKSSFECLTERELREGLSEVLELFLDEEFTDSLRPFSHYFND